MVETYRYIQIAAEPLRGRFEFHVARSARDYYDFDQSIYELDGNVIFANFHAARLFADKMNARRDLLNFPERAVRAGQINAMGLVDEILHYVIGLYRKQANPDALAKALDWLYSRFDPVAVDATLRKFAGQFPALAVYRGDTDLESYFEGETDGIPNRQVLLEEMILLWLANMNPAFNPFAELFDDTYLERQSIYPEILASLHEFFDTQPAFGPDNQNLIDMLRAPALAHPDSLTAQLEFMRTRWLSILGEYLQRLLSSLDFIKEEEKATFFGPGPIEGPSFMGLEYEIERFSEDMDWMPRLVLMAKNAYVWLDQLSKQYQRDINRLDQIPDEELDKLREWGITGLWLIGLWERSHASKAIKQRMGNPDAVASAYSLYDYRIADDLGGQQAIENLRARAWQRGIRMASDMVPNHMGIDSRWVVERPDWFLGLDYSPFPSYSFNGPDLCEDERVGVYLEDHYYDHSDAAVVFKRVDHYTGGQKFIYHGNDGTSMPWNDTAQINFLNPEAREAVIQTILAVARQFPVIRFDAAMTLARKHIQRLWFPEPGSGGAIPSRAEHGMPKDQFHALMPVEFWREVVDRVAQEVPDTLLLAEAFWMMEGYFVRTLGMHRVYNSAFMHMLRDEDNAKYRGVMKDTLEFDPRILKRFVNFMNNPDEETAVEQFGKDNKYFGVCTLMATLPGLPMFGHGQFQGFYEKYGMEYRRAKWDEQVDQDLVERHKHQIFPLLHRRYLFAEVENFLMYDFYTPEGYVNEDVYAYSNRFGDQRALVIYHNRYADVRGWVKFSARYMVKGGDGDGSFMQKTLGEGLALPDDAKAFVIFKDYVSGLEYIRSSKDLIENGLYFELDAYKVQVFMDFRVIQDEDGRYARLAAELDGRGVSSIEEELREYELQPVLAPYRELVNAGMLRFLIDNRLTETGEVLDPETFNQSEYKMLAVLKGAQVYAGGKGDAEVIAGDVRGLVEAILQLAVFPERFPLSRSRKYQWAYKLLASRLEDVPENWATLLCYAFTRELGRIQMETGYKTFSLSWLDEWLLGKVQARAFQDLGLDEGRAWRQVGIVKLLVAHQDWYTMESTKKERLATALKAWLNDLAVQQFVQVHRYDDVLWFNKEAFEEFIWWMFAAAVVDVTAQSQVEESRIADDILAVYDPIKQLLALLEDSEYQVEKLLELAQG